MRRGAHRPNAAPAATARTRCNQRERGRATATTRRPGGQGRGVQHHRRAARRPRVGQRRQLVEPECCRDALRPPRRVGRGETAAALWRPHAPSRARGSATSTPATPTCDRATRPRQQAGPEPRDEGPLVFGPGAVHDGDAARQKLLRLRCPCWTRARRTAGCAPARGARLVCSSPRPRAGARRTPRPATTRRACWGRRSRRPLAPTGSDEGCDLLARDLHGDVVTPATALAWAELVADGAPRGPVDARRAVRRGGHRLPRGTRRAPRPGRRPGALRRGAGSRGSEASRNRRPPSCGASCAKRWAGATATPPRRSSASSSAGARRAARRRPWTCCSTPAPRPAT